MIDKQNPSSKKDSRAKAIYVLLTGLCISLVSSAQQEISLYDMNPLQVTKPVRKDANGSLFGDYTPTLIKYLPDIQNATGAAVIICPGGGYSSLVIGTEGYPIADYFVKRGIAAFILKYRLPNADKLGHPDLAPLEDVQQALKSVRQNAAKWNIDPGKIGLMGFSAGGHLVSTAGTHFNQVLIADKENISVRPDFMLLVYPLISLSDSLGHAGSRSKLLGNHPTPEMVKLYSNETQVNANTPPAFLLHSGDDSLVKVANSILFYQALQHSKVSAEMHIYPEGGHGGFVLRIPKDEWMPLCIKWINTVTGKKK